MRNPRNLGRQWNEEWRWHINEVGANGFREFILIDCILIELGRRVKGINGFSFIYCIWQLLRVVRVISFSALGFSVLRDFRVKMCFRNCRCTLYIICKNEFTSFSAKSLFNCTNPISLLKSLRFQRGMLANLVKLFSFIEKLSSEGYKMGRNRLAWK